MYILYSAFIIFIFISVIILVVNLIKLLKYKVNYYKIVSQCDECNIKIDEILLYLKKDNM